MEPWLEFSGRLHPILVHAPIGSLVTLVFLELWAKLRRRSAPAEARRLIAFVTAGSAALAAGAGWLLSSEGYGGDGLVWHRAFGIAFAVSACLLWVASLIDHARGYRALFWISGLLAVAAGHQGAEMTHGEGYLFEPFRSEASGEESVVEPPSEEEVAPRAAAPRTLVAPNTLTAAPVAPVAGVYEREVAPILQGHCYACHGPSKQKSGFAMHEPELLLRGGYGGESLVPGDAAASELVRRLRLPIDDEEHMPPAEKPQPSEAQIEAIAAWIDAGAELPTESER